MYVTHQIGFAVLVIEPSGDGGEKAGYQGIDCHEERNLRCRPAHFRRDRRVVQSDGVAHQAKDESRPEKCGYHYDPGVIAFP